jgi:vacuolar-type H+-ATPase subunit H
MDRDPNNTYGTTGGSTGGSESSGANPGFQNTGTGYDAGGLNAGSTGGNLGAGGTTTGREYTDGSSEGSRDLGARAREARETAKERLGQARETASEKLGEARNKAHEMKHTFADKLDAGAERLRSRTNRGDASYATADGSMSAITTNDSASGVGEKVAGGMHSTADWLRQNDMESMKRGVEEQVRTNPGRSLLVAAVAGYLIGKVLRR